ncbi:MAG: lipid-A-disaccharide synthase, partial [Deltaproteobacteria bacterium]|nr:lipid-A-disaccharide synthase [Deltaproteobacteria bacterium]
AGLKGINSKELSVVGITEVAAKLPVIFKAYNQLKALLRKERFDAVVLIDYPDFNLRFAKAAVKSGVPIVYYISPQVWAWRKGRINLIRRVVDKMLVILPFEEAIYKDAGVSVEYVGNPLYEETSSTLTKDEAREKLSLNKDKTTLALLPGSRTEEVTRLLPTMLKGVELLKGVKDFELLLPAADTIKDKLLDELLSKTPLTVRVIRGDFRSVVKASDAVVVASGTATLEVALLETPMVIVYKVSTTSYMVGRLLINLENIGLPNIVAKERVVNELIQGNVTPENIAREIGLLLNDNTRIEAVKEGYARIIDTLKTDAPANIQAAKAVLNVLEEKRKNNP